MNLITASDGEKLKEYLENKTNTEKIVKQKDVFSIYFTLSGQDEKFVADMINNICICTTIAKPLPEVMGKLSTRWFTIPQTLDHKP